jgi:hypothetical protein
MKTHRLSLRPLGAFTLAAFPLLGLVAAPTSPTTETTPTAAPYTNQPQSVPYYPPSVPYQPFYDRANNFPNTFHSELRYTSHPLRSVFFFPPVPPPLGGPLVLFRNYRLGQPESVLPQLKSHVGEPFYAPLSAHLHREDLSKKRLQRLDAYAANRTALLAELRAQLTAARDADPATRRQALAAFAVQQAPRLIAHEAEAEAIRENLVNGSFFHAGADWNDNRTWALGDDLRYESRADEFKVFRASAFFTAGLSPAQRRLLREFAIELDDPLGDPTASVALDAPRPVIFFSPETARFERPAKLSPEIAARLDAYRDAKSALKSELRAVIYRQDRAYFEFTRTNALRALAEKQAPALAALEVQAEEIRELLAPLPRPSRPATPGIPPELNRRIGVYLREKQDLQRTLIDRLAAIKSEFPTHRVEFIREGAGYAIEIITNRRASRAEIAKVDAIKAQLATFNAEQTRRLAALAAEKDRIHHDITVAVKARLGSAENSLDLDLLLKNFADQFERQEIWQRYRDYDIAVFEPGLSPEQRRLLFADALVQLDLPLPPGSRDP